MFGPMVDAEWLIAHLSQVRVVDVRWRLGQPQHGRASFAAGRVPGAVYLDLDEDLSDLSEPNGGRHPLPSPSDAARTLAAAGIGPDTPVVVYDDLSGAVAARLWWMLGWLGGPPAAVLDGGFDAWRAAGGPVAQGPSAPPAPARP